MGDLKTNIQPIDGKWQVYLVDASGDRVGNPMTFPQSFAGAMAFCRGYISRASDIATGLIPVPFACVANVSQPAVEFDRGEKDWDGWRLAVVGDLPCNCRVNVLEHAHPNACVSRLVTAMTDKTKIHIDTEFLYIDVNGQTWPYAYVPAFPLDKLGNDFL